MEVVVSAFVLITVTLGSLSLIDQGQKVTVKNRARSTSADLADQAQESLRALDPITLGGSIATGRGGYHPAPVPTVVGNVSYTVSQSADWQQDKTGAAPTCLNTDGVAEYLRLTTSVQSTAGNTSVPAQTVVSYLTPDLGAYGKHVGTLAVKVTDRTGAGIQNVPVTLAGPQAGSLPTNAAGCSPFLYYPVGGPPAATYTATIGTGTTLVDINGNTTPIVSTATLTDNSVTTISKQLDKAATLGVSLTPKYGTNTGTNTAQAYGFTVHNGTPAVTRIFSSSPTRTLLTGTTATNLFPFTSSYDVYSGICSANDPARYTSPSTSYLAPILSAGGTGSVAVQQPSITLTYNKTIGSGAGTVTPQPNAPVLLTLKVKDTVGDCGTNLDTYTFNTTTDSNGQVVANVPWGSYDYCVDDRAGSNNYVRSVGTVTNTNGTAAGNPLNVIVPKSPTKSATTC